MKFHLILVVSLFYLSLVVEAGHQKTHQNVRSSCGSISQLHEKSFFSRRKEMFWKKFCSKSLWNMSKMPHFQTKVLIGYWSNGNSKSILITWGFFSECENCLNDFLAAGTSCLDDGNWLWCLQDVIEGASPCYSCICELVDKLCTVLPNFCQWKCSQIKV